MSKNFITVIFTIIFMFALMVISLIFEKNQLVMIDSKVSDLKIEYEKIKSETDLLFFEINSIIALDKLKKIAVEKQFNYPSQEQIVIINE